MEYRPVARATGSNKNIVEVYPGCIELHSGWHNYQTDTLDLKDVSEVFINGSVSCTLTIRTNEGRRWQIEHLDPSEAHEVKAAAETHKQKAGLYG